MPTSRSPYDAQLTKLAKRIAWLKKYYDSMHSPYCEVKDSPIHYRGVYASCPIPAKTRIIEYLGEPISKEESEERSIEQDELAEITGEGAVYLFTLDEHWDLDGNLPWNMARLINHSCSPNCEAWIEDFRIFIYSLRDIKEGEELTFDYGFSIENYEDHPCRCGSKDCVGYIVSQEVRDQLRALLQKKNS